MSKDFSEMTVSELNAYAGPTFHSSVKWLASDGNVVKSDHTSPDGEIEKKKITRYANSKIHVLGVEYGPIVTHHGMVIERDSLGNPLPDRAERYMQARV